MKARTHRLLRKIHRKVGVFLSLFLILLAVTGVLLNHSEQFLLSKNHIPGFMAAWYIEPEPVTGFLIEDTHLYASEGMLIAGESSLTHCPVLLDAVPLTREVALLCTDGLILLTHQFEFIERIEAIDGFPEEASAVGRVGDELAVQLNQRWFLFDPLSWELTPLPQIKAVSELDSTEVPTSLTLGRAVTWQQFILDVHSGAVVGLSGRLFNDLVAVMLIMMAFSGIIMWRKSSAKG